MTTPPPSEAERLLQSLAVQKAADIDLDAIAWSVGVVEIRERTLDGCEARIVGESGRAVISVKRGVRPTRQRFSICHELGHWHHHKGQLLYCKAVDMQQSQVAAAKEGVANRYASDLLLPPYLIRPLLHGRKFLDVDIINSVAEEFQASQRATAFKLTQMIDIPTMLVCYGPAGRKWHVPGPLVPRTWYPRSDLDPRSQAFQLLYSGEKRIRPPQRGKASLWFDRGDAERGEVSEQSFRSFEGDVLTLLTFMNHSQMFSEGDWRR